MEALFESQPGAPVVLIGQPNFDQRRIDNPLTIPDALSFLTYRAEGGSERPERLPRRSMAVEHCTALLQLPHHGGTGHDLYPRERLSLRQPPHEVDFALTPLAQIWPGLLAPHQACGFPYLGLRE
jgi:hypothetical protein